MKMGVKRRYERNPYRKRRRKEWMHGAWRTMCALCLCVVLGIGGIVMGRRVAKSDGSNDVTPSPAAEPQPMQSGYMISPPSTIKPSVQPTVLSPAQPTNSPKTGALQDAFSDALFIGDSRTEGLKLYAGLEANFLTAKGIMVNTAFTKPAVMGDSGEKMTIVEAIGQAQYKRVYVMLGVNELGWVHSDQFIQDYARLVRKIKELQPSATIYVQSILPVTKEKSQSNSVYTNEKIEAYNQLIRQMTTSEGVQYLDVTQAVKDADGALPTQATSDGVHLNKIYVQKWAAFLRQKTGRK